jgi:hypothetical protein
MTGRGERNEKRKEGRERKLERKQRKESREDERTGGDLVSRRKRKETRACEFPVAMNSELQENQCFYVAVARKQQRLDRCLRSGSGSSLS